jgi:hypothetical protein
VKIVTPVRDVPNLFKLGFVEDPWGTKIEVVQDTGLLGLHHIHLRAADPAEMFTWLLAKFGGERTKLKGQIDAVKYSAAGFSDMWVLVQRGESAPSDGHAIDHIGWRATNLVEKIAELKTAGVKVLTEALAHTLRNVEGQLVSAHLLIPGSTFTGMTSRGRTEKPPGAWVPHQVVEMLIDGMHRGDFYILCPDNDVTREIDNRRILWAAQDITENRPALSRWHADYGGAFERFLAGQ